MATQTLYRLIKNKHKDSAFEGEGARLYGGRWNSKGHRCVYVASSQSLAVLEVLVHIEDRELLNHFIMLSIDIDDKEIMVLNTEDLPDNWQEEPAPADTATVGDEWLESKQSLGLELPSTIIPNETNILLKCIHPAFNDAMTSITEIPFTPDKRLTR